MRTPEEKVDECQLKSVLCVVCVFGQASVSDDEGFSYRPEMLNDLAKEKNVAIVIRLPRNDRFGLTDIFHEMTAISEKSELLSSHSFLHARGHKLKAEQALRGMIVKQSSRDGKRIPGTYEQSGKGKNEITMTLIELSDDSAPGQLPRLFVLTGQKYQAEIITLYLSTA
jgi:hypothetical protein